MCLKVDQNILNKEINVPLGKDEGGNEQLLDLNKASHVLVAGKTGSGKSIFLHKVINSIATNYYKKEIDLVLIDLKQTEFYKYKEGVVDNLAQAKAFLGDLASKINAKERQEEKPTIIIVDECADLLLDDRALELLCLISARGRGINTHLILSTQMISPNALVPSLRANLQTRICFPVADREDSILILHKEGAEKLKKGEFLYKSPYSDEIKRYKVKW